jgi:hypothetical protein
MLRRFLIVFNVSLEGKTVSEDIGLTPCTEKYHKITIVYHAITEPIAGQYVFYGIERFRSGERVRGKG